MSDVVKIDYYTDSLCVWAWIVQKRVDELKRKWGDKIHLRSHCVNVFGDTAERIEARWQERGGFDGFATHVEESAAPYETAPVNPKIWREVRPTSSAMAHVVIKAAAIAAGEDRADGLALAIRRAFFIDAIDIGHRDALFEIASAAGMDIDKLETAIDSGAAVAALMADYDRANQHGIKGSPSWVMNQGRQVLYGNVGYRLINANIEELVRQPEGEASWC